MAGLRKIPKSPYWIARITLPDGRSTNRSTGTTDRGEAQRIANALEDACTAAKRGELTEARARKTIAEIFAIANQRSLPSSTVRDFLEGWLKQRQIEAAPATYQKYRGAAQGFLRFLGPKADQDLIRLSRHDFASYRDALVGRVSAATANMHLKILRAAFGRARKDGLVEVNEAQRVDFAKRHGPGFKRRAFTIGELHAVLRVADEEWRGMILLGVYSGQRLGDLVALRWGQFDLANQELNLVTGKTGRQQVVPLHDVSVRYLSALPGDRDPARGVFPRLRSMYQSGRHNGALSNEFRALLTKAGLLPKQNCRSRKNGRSARRDQSELSFHSLRHTATSLLKSAGVSDAVARDLIGHDSAAVSAHYTAISVDAKRDAISRLPDLRRQRGSRELLKHEEAPMAGASQTDTQ